MGRLLLWEVQPRSTPAPAAEAVQERRAALRAVAQAAETLARQENPALTMEEVVGQAVASVPGCEEAGITLVRARRSIETPAATAPLAARCDQLQHALSEGPCLDAFDTNQIVRVDDLADDLRWPRFVQEAVELGVRSVLTLPLTTPRGMVGTLNLYSSKPDAFDMDSELVGSAYATHAAIALMHADLEENLRIGLSTREEIGRAVGILMERHRINATGAFDMLVYASQHAHRKLRDVAMWVNETGEDPDSLLPSR
jgi:GAF domain-containing protein